jgi:uncharacterized lipoprotein YmbA
MSALRRVTTRGIAAIALAGLALGCLGRSPQVRFYTMSGMPGPSTAEVAEDLAIGVGPVQLPGYLDRPELVTRAEGSQLEVDEYNRWAGGLESNLLRALGDDLGTRLATQRVVVYPTDAPFPLDYRVTLDVQEFEGRPGHELVLRVRWVIRAPDAGRGPWSGQSLIRRSLSGGGVEDLVAGHDEAVGLLADAIASRIAELAAERRDAGESSPDAAQPSGS